MHGVYLWIGFHALHCVYVLDDNLSYFGRYTIVLLSVTRSFLWKLKSVTWKRYLLQLQHLCAECFIYLWTWLCFYDTLSDVAVFDVYCSEGQSGNPRAVFSNVFCISEAVSGVPVVYQYHVDFSPEVPSQRIRKVMINSLKAIIGDVSITDGMLLFLPVRLDNEVRFKKKEFGLL